ncbi:hypothetical protein [Streptomyces sp. NPDC001389]|uniref:hypothetical protein n=1 Tax=Streptomyces sp. NPDC001389 TaxID=3364569 RepID=UPI003690096D
MNRATLAAAAAITAALLAGCSTTTPKATPSSQAGQPAPASSKAAADANGAFAAISAAVPTAKLGATVTAENDPNHLLGRPGQYTSKITFIDGRIKATDTEGLQAGDIGYGGSVETFASNADAKTRHDYIQTVTKGVPGLAEYDYLHGTTLIRVSHLLTPEQAADYEKAATKLP